MRRSAGVSRRSRHGSGDARPRRRRLRRLGIGDRRSSRCRRRSRCVDLAASSSIAPAHPHRLDPAPFVAAYARVFEALGERSYDVVHNHAFDAPAIRCAIGIAAPVVAHAPPSTREAPSSTRFATRRERTHPPVIATVSTAQAEAWRQFVEVDTVLRVGVATERIPWSATPGSGAVFAGRFSPEKGAVDAIAIARRAGLSIDLYGDAL